MSVKQGREGRNLKMKFRLKLKVCEARQRGVDFKDEV